MVPDGTNKSHVFDMVCSLTLPCQCQIIKAGVSVRGVSNLCYCRIPFLNYLNTSLQKELLTHCKNSWNYVPDRDFVLFILIQIFHWLYVLYVWIFNKYIWNCKQQIYWFFYPFTPIHSFSRVLICFLRRQKQNYQQPQIYQQRQQKRKRRKRKQAYQVFMITRA